MSKSLYSIECFQVLNTKVWRLLLFPHPTVSKLISNTFFHCYSIEVCYVMMSLFLLKCVYHSFYAPLVLYSVMLGDYLSNSKSSRAFEVKSKYLSLSNFHFYFLLLSECSIPLGAKRNLNWTENICWFLKMSRNFYLHEWKKRIKPLCFGYQEYIARRHIFSIEPLKYFVQSQISNCYNISQVDGVNWFASSATHLILACEE